MDKRSIAWLDSGGRTAQTFLKSTAGAPLTQAALLAQSNAGIIDWFEGTDHEDNNPPIPGATYAPVELAAALLFRDSGGNVATVTLPAPLRSIFLADGQTVDPAAIAAIIAAATAELVGVTNLPLVSFIAGSLRSKKTYA